MARFTGGFVAGIVGIVVLALIGVVLLPYLFIWAVNTLFALDIPFTVWTWLAVVVLWLFLLSTRGLAFARHWKDMGR